MLLRILTAAVSLIALGGSLAGAQAGDIIDKDLLVQLARSPDPREALKQFTEQTKAPLSPEAEQQRAALASTAGTLGLPSEQVLVQGLVQFLAKRAQDEVVLVYLDHLRAPLDSTGSASNFRCLVPASIAAFDNLSKVSAQTGLPSVAKAFAADLGALGSHLSGRECLHKVLNSNSADVDWLLAGINVFETIRVSGNPVLALSKLSDPGTIPKDTSSSVTLWVGALGLLADECRKDPSYLATDSTTPTKVNELLARVVLRLRDELGFDADHVTQVAMKAEYLLSALRSLQQIDKAIQSLPLEKRTDPKVAAQVLGQVLVEVSAIVRDIGFAASNGVPSALSRKLELLDVASQLERAIVNNDWVSCSERLLYSFTLVQAKPPSEVVEFLQFGSALSTCKTSDEVSQVLSAFALPAGSYRAKRRASNGRAAPSQFCLNAYVGPGWAGESAVNSGSVKSSGHSLGLLATIGVEWSTGMRWQRVPVSSFSLLLSAVDPGNLLQVYYSGGDTLSSASSVSFSDILAPGAFIVFGIAPTLPLSVAGGCELLPHLRVGSDGERVDVKRFVIMVALDMPLLRF